MKMNTISKGLLGLAALGMSGSAMAVSVNVNGTVQSTLAVVKVLDVELGTVFATASSTGFYRYMTLSTAGAFSASLGSASTSLLSLGGQAAGEAQVNALTTAPFTVTLPSAEATLSPAGAAALPATTETISVAHLTDGAAGSGSFRLVNFRAGSPTNGTAAAGCATGITCVITPTAVGNVNFKIGADVATETTGITAATNDSYSDGAYLGSFTVTATY